MDTATKTGQDAAKTASRKVAHRASEATDEFIGNKIANKIVKPKPVPNENCWKMLKCWKNSYSPREKTINIIWIKTSINGTP